MSGTQKGNEHGYAGALYKPASSGNRIPAVDEFKQIRELRTVRDKLYKEIEKLNGRSDVLAQDNTKLRNANFSQQREIKILRSINEKVAAEKNQLAAEFERCKEQRDKLEANFSRLSNALVLQSHIDSLKGHIDSLNNELYKAHNQIKDRDDSIKKLNEEIDALNIALDNHVHYDKGGKKSKNGDTLSRETLRDMCYNMAKKEAELHNMSVSLAEVFAKLEASKRTSEELLQDRDSFKMQLDESLNRFEILEDILEKTNEENNKLSKNNNSLSDTNLRLEQMIEDLSRRCSEARQGREECSEALSAQTAELKALKEEYQSAVSSLKKKIESAQVAMAHKDTVMAMCEQRLSYDRDQLTAEKEVMNDKLQRVDYLEREIEILRASSLSQIENRDEAVSQLQHELRASRSDLEQYRRELSESSSKTSSHDQLVQERDTLSNALQSAMATSKGVKAKLQHEIKRREVAEAALAAAEQQVRTSEENLKYTEQSKAQYSFAVLDAYQKEREKTAILEKELNFLRASVHNIDFGKRSKSSDQPHENNPMPPTPPESPIKETTPARANLPAISASSPVRQVDPKVAATRDLIGTIQRIRGDLNKVIADDVGLPIAQEIDQTIYYNADLEEEHFSRSSDSDDLVGSNIFSKHYNNNSSSNIK